MKKKINYNNIMNNKNDIIEQNQILFYFQCVNFLLDTM